MLDEHCPRQQADTTRNRCFIAVVVAYTISNYTAAIKSMGSAVDYDGTMISTEIPTSPLFRDSYSRHNHIRIDGQLVNVPGAPCAALDNPNKADSFLLQP